MGSQKVFPVRDDSVGGNGNDGVFHIDQSSRIETLQSNAV